MGLAAVSADWCRMGRMGRTKGVQGLVLEFQAFSLTGAAD